MTKVSLWSLTSYDRVVFLDPRSLIQKNPDALFACEGFCAAGAVHSPSSSPSGRGGRGGGGGPREAALGAALLAALHLRHGPGAVPGGARGDAGQAHADPGGGQPRGAGVPVLVPDGGRHRRRRPGHSVRRPGRRWRWGRRWVRWRSSRRRWQLLGGRAHAGGAPERAARPPVQCRARAHLGGRVPAPAVHVRGAVHRLPGRQEQLGGRGAEGRRGDSGAAHRALRRRGHAVEEAGVPPQAPVLEVERVPGAARVPLRQLLRAVGALLHPLRRPRVRACLLQDGERRQRRARPQPQDTLRRRGRRRRRASGRLLPFEEPDPLAAECKAAAGAPAAPAAVGHPSRLRDGRCVRRRRLSRGGSGVQVSELVGRRRRLHRGRGRPILLVPPLLSRGRRRRRRRRRRAAVTGRGVLRPVGAGRDVWSVVVSGGDGAGARGGGRQVAPRYLGLGARRLAVLRPGRRTVRDGLPVLRPADPRPNAAERLGCRGRRCFCGPIPAFHGDGRRGEQRRRRRRRRGRDLGGRRRRR
ncbi:unnamed protein product, partial [Ectocarpus sp. 8 AP-2014]